MFSMASLVGYVNTEKVLYCLKIDLAKPKSGASDCNKLTIKEKKGFVYLGSGTQKMIKS